MGTLISSNALADSERRVLFLKRRYDLDIRSGLNGMRISWAVSVGELSRFSFIRCGNSKTDRTLVPSLGLYMLRAIPGLQSALMSMGEVVGRVDTVRGVRPSP